MSNSRVWLFRGLVVVAAGLMLLSWFMPWWRCYFTAIGDWVQIRPWGLENTIGAYAYYIRGSEMPIWFSPLMWTYLGICIALLLFSLFAKKKAVGLGKFKFSLPQVVIGGVGLSYILIVVLAVIVAAIRTGDYFELPLIGRTVIDLGGHGEFMVSDAVTGLLFGYWLACGVGPLCIVLALLRDRIIGKPKLSA